MHKIMQDFQEVTRLENYYVNLRLTVIMWVALCLVKGLLSTPRTCCVRRKSTRKIY